MRKLMILGASLLTILSLVNCGGKGGDSSQDTSSQSSTKKPYVYKEVGTKTETSVEVKFHVNLPNDNDLYRLVHVEPGNTIDSFKCVVSGYYSSDWYYDVFGTFLFSFDTIITENMSLYAYPAARRDDTSVSDWPIEIKDYTITWTIAENVSYVPADTGVIPKTADQGETIEFKLNYSLTAEHDSIVSVNGKTISPNEEGIYSFVVTGNTIVSLTDATYYDPIAGKQVEYTFTNVPTDILGTNNKIYMWSWGGADGASEGIIDYANRTVTFKVSEFNTGFLLIVHSASVSQFTWDGALYKTTDQSFTSGVFTYDAEQYFIAGPTETYTVTNIPSWCTADGCVVVAWVWGGTYGGGQWVPCTYGNGGTNLTLPLDGSATGMLLVRCIAGTTTPDWSNKSETAGRIYNQTDNTELIAGVTTYQSASWKDYNPNW